MSKELYCGVDLHSTNGVYHVVRADGTSVRERRIRNHLPAVLELLNPFKEELECVAVESTYNWYWLADGLQDAGFCVKLANPAAIEQYNGLKHTDDDSDAAFIAELLRLGILPTGWICPREDRALRDLLRRRMLLVQSRTRLVNSLQSMFVRQTGTQYKRKVIEDLDTAEVQRLLRHETLTTVALEQLRLIQRHDEGIGSLERSALQLCRPTPQHRLLCTAPGIGPILAMVIMLEIGDIGRFPRPGMLSSYCRAVKSVRTSNRKAKGRNNAHNGNRCLAWAFVEAANHAVRCCPPARKWYQRKSASTLPVVGRKALSSKLSKAVWYMLTENKPFDISRVFG